MRTRLIREVFSNQNPPLEGDKSMSTTDNAPLTIRDMIEPAIKAAGGWVNTHAHADRAYTLSPDVLEMRRTCTLQQKWDALDRLKRESTEEDFYRRFSIFFENQIAQGVTALATFVDIDPQSEDRAIKAGIRAREHYKDQLTVKFANQTLKGVIHPEARKWFDIGAELVDIIGALPKRDERDYGKGDEAFDIILSTAKRLNKMVHVHVDQFNESLEYETSAKRRSSTAWKDASSPFTASRSARTRKPTASVSTRS